MKIFLDTANLDEIRQGVAWGVVDGVTTNPTLIAREGRPLEEQVRKICELVDGDVSVEVLATDAEGIVQQARRLAAIHPQVVVKIPVTREGVQATRQLSREGIRVNATLCFSPTQALLAAKAGAYVVSPFVGRLDDISSPGMELIRDILLIYRNYQFPTQVLVASVRSPVHVLEAAKAGAHIVTMPFTVLDALFNHPLTSKGLERFLEDWRKAFGETYPARER